MTFFLRSANIRKFEFKKYSFQISFHLVIPIQCFFFRFKNKIKQTFNKKLSSVSSVITEPIVNLPKILNMSIEKDRQEIIEMFGNHFEQLYNIPPLAARILGTLIIDGCKTGLTFESLIEKMGASKSSISTNLNLLLKMDKISYITKAGDRKKYFKPADLSQRLDNYLKLVDSEQVILNRMVDYREKTASCPEEICNLQNVRAYREHVQEVKKLFLKTIDEFKRIEIQNKSNK